MPAKAKATAPTKAKKSTRKTAATKRAPRKKAAVISPADLLNVVSSAVMTLDKNLVVTYVNRTLVDLFTDHGEGLRQLSPGFDAANLAGMSIDQFNVFSPEQRNCLIHSASQPFIGDVTIGNTKFQVTANAVTTARGATAGFAMEWSDVTSLRNSDGQLLAIGKSQAVIEFSLDGTILDANENFWGAIGYTLEEIQGKHHSVFVDTAYATSPEYRQFWADLNDGKFNAGEFKRFGNGGKEIWIQASYNPIFDMNGKPFKVVKYATDVTAEKLRNANYEGQLSAIGKSQAVIEFSLDGTILDANENFCAAVGYTLEEIQGKHHSVFVDSAYAASLEYRQFWADLNEGKFNAGEFKRFANGGREIWIQASYNPIFDMNGKPFKVVKYASDITAAKMQAADFSGQLSAIGKSQAVIEFNLDGTILDANENFCAAVGYTLEEIQGKHHSVFVDSTYAASPEYRQFWADLNEGKFNAGEFKRFANGGREIWIQASYNPIFDMNGKPFKVVKYASDITAEKTRNADFAGQLSAIDKVQATIEFDLDGRIQFANENFLSTVGYALQEVQGRHHSMFVEPAFAESSEYRQFWADLKDGRFQSAQYKRLGKGGKEVWIQASYNPIFDLNGKPYKVVKYATDITAAKQMEFEIAERQKLDAVAAEEMKANVTQILDVANRVAQGDYSAEITVAGADGIGQLGEGLQALFADKHVAETAEKARLDREREEATVQRQKVEQVLEIVNAVAQGNFDITVPDLGDDSVGQVATALQSAVTSIRSALVEVRTVSQTVAAAANELNSASGEISRGAQHQASSLEETASSLEEITTTVKQNTDNAQQARELANGSRDVADMGGSVVGDAVKAMSEINNASTKISDIITTIDEIAFQTNLLALNAAVEAARAGERASRDADLLLLRRRFVIWLNAVLRPPRKSRR